MLDNKTKNTVNISTENDIFQLVQSFKTNRQKRHKSKKFFVEWVKSINLAVENWRDIEYFIYGKEAKPSSWAQWKLDSWIARKNLCFTEELLAKISDKENLSELIAIINMKEDNIDRIKSKKDLFVVVVDRPSNPWNLWTIIRSCNSFGVDALIITWHSTDLYDPKTIQSSVGTIFSMDILRLESSSDILPLIDNIKSNIWELQIIWTTVKTDITIDNTEFKAPLILLIWNETDWLNAAYKQMCDKLVKIPIFGAASSLNVGCATSIFLYEISKHIR